MSHVTPCQLQHQERCLSLLTQNPCPYAPFGVIVNLVMGLCGVPGVKTLHSQCRGPGFSPWSGSYKIPHATRHSQKKKKKTLVTQCLFSVFSILQSRP